MIYKNQRLMQFVKCAGCAAKLDSASLHKITGLLKPDKAVLSGINTNEDASIYRINDELALAQSLDFITPIVDSAYHFGAIAAANSLSDIFAMGGVAMNALNIVGFDRLNFDESVLIELLQGAKDKCDEAGAVLVGGHTITSSEMFFGLSVTGSVHPRKFIANNTARAGDILVLTKPLGTGILSTALKANELENALLDELLSGMMSLNLRASRILCEFAPTAMTDITGFGLLGHAKEMLNENICIEIHKDKVPFYSGVREKLALGLVPGGAYNNQKAVQEFVKFDENSSKFDENSPANLNQNATQNLGKNSTNSSQNASLPQNSSQNSPTSTQNTKPQSIDNIAFFDPQTSGGLLCALPPQKAEFALDALQKAGINAHIIGKVRQLLKDEKPFIRLA